VREEREDRERGDGEGVGSQATLCACVSEERGHEEGDGMLVRMLLCCQIPMNVYACVSEERGNGEGWCGW